MNKILVAAVTILCLCSCGVGSYTVSSGRADEGYVTFVSPKAYGIKVIVDDSEFSVSSVKNKAYRKDRKIKQTVKNTVRVSPGTHDVRVLRGGKTIYSKKLFISATEHKIIDLP